MTFVEINSDLAFFILRLAVGIVFLAHGPQKLQNTSRAAKSMGMNSGLVALVGVMETLGALSMILGTWTQIGAVFLGIIMLGAIYMKTQRWGKGFTGENGWELDFILLFSVLAIFLGSSTTYGLL